MNVPSLFELPELLAILPHRPPFLFVDRVVALEPFKRIVAERELRPDEPQFAGHFPGHPIMPGVLVTEALGQASGLLLGLSERVAGTEPPAAGPKLFYLAAEQVKYKRPAVPGEVLRLCAEAEANWGGLYRFQAEAWVGQTLIAGGLLTLARMDVRE